MTSAVTHKRAGSRKLVRWMRNGSRCWRGLTSRPRLATLGVGVLSFAIAATVALVAGVPKPSVHDEFSYLLAADTFAAGRLTNPPHNMAVFLEGFQFLVTPTYMSKYPPAQGLMLAAGKMLTDQAIVGVWLSVGLLGAALCWMLRSVMTTGWAALGAVLGVLQFGAVGSWGQSYWGGALAATGGALTLGAVLRLVWPRWRSGRVRALDAVILGVGLLTLANSRPMEGLCFSVPCGLAMAMWLIDRRSVASFADRWFRAALPCALVMALGIAWMTHYNTRITGNWRTMPYQVYERTYASVPLLVFQSSRGIVKPTYNHPRLEYLWQSWETSRHNEHRSFEGLTKLTWRKLVNFAHTMIGPVLGMSLVMLPWALRRKWAWLALACGVAAALAGTASRAGFVHYAAPMAAASTLLVTSCLRYIRPLRLRGDPVGRWLITALVAVMVVSLVPSTIYESRLRRTDWGERRSQMVDALRKQGGKHLVIIRQSPTADIHRDWVQNEADIDASPVVFARDMGDLRNAELLEYFKGRALWLMEPPKVELRPYTSAR